MEVQLGREIQRAFREEGIDIVTGNDFQQVQSAAADGGTEAIQQGVTVETTVDGDSPGCSPQRHSSSRLESSPIAKISV